MIAVTSPIPREFWSPGLLGCWAPWAGPGAGSIALIGHLFSSLGEATLLAFLHGFLLLSYFLVCFAKASASTV